MVYPFVIREQSRHADHNFKLSELAFMMETVCFGFLIRSVDLQTCWNHRSVYYLKSTSESDTRRTRTRTSLWMDDQLPQYQLLSSTRYDPHLKSFNWNDDQEGPTDFFLLPFHFERLVSAAQTHGWTKAESALEYLTLKSACMKAVSLQSNDVCRSFKVSFPSLQWYPRCPQST